MTTKKQRALASNLGLLLLRLATSAMMMTHGLAKLERWDALSTEFADPIGLGPAVSAGLAIFAELLCSIAVAAGALTRFAAVPPLVTMLVAAFIVHAEDPFARKELALLYATGFASIVLLGPGRYSVDGMLRAPRSRRGR